MCQTFPARLRHSIAVVLLAVIVLLVAAPAADAFQGAAVIVPGFFNMMDIVQDRSRLIQFSVVAVALGIALLWWGNKT